MTNRRNPVLAMGLLTSAMLTLTACPVEDPALQIADGIFGDALGDPVAYATAEQMATFERGKAVALRRFTVEEGLGPNFNASFCGSCHEKPLLGGGAARYRNFNLVGQRLSDGSFTETGLNGVQTQFLVDGTRNPTDPGTNVVATRNPIPFFGVGVLAEISGEEILKRADPEDRDGDGISGRPNFDRGFVGRFGRKSQTVSIEGFIRGPLFNHMGLTSNPLSDDRKRALPVPSAADLADDTPAVREGGLQVAQLAQAAAPDEPTLDDDDAADPELAEQDLFDVVAMSMLLAAPRPDAVLSEAAEAGQARFLEIGCASCHTPTLRSPRGLIPVYSDLLLHDMGPEMADGIPMKVATGSEFRTQPLWGVVAVAPYLHDGRADTLDEAIRWHGGEGQRARDAYVALDATAQGEIMAFLESLGGREQASAGLLPPNAPIPEVGEYGGPARALSAAEADRFDQGRALFDEDMAVKSGLGPTFNGDACRACHFDPTIGGAGSADVNVVRSGYIDPETGVFEAPEGGTILHRFTTMVDARPEGMLTGNHSEQRQTPPLFGLGLVDRIPEATILAGEDPDDLDGDGISGRAHILDDGRLGRLGWKAQVPSLREFVRDAMSAELGVTLEDQADLTFGAATDDDDVPDPEMTADDLSDIVFFMAELAPPPRTRTDVALEDAGEALFTQVGCDGCHTPSMQTRDGIDVQLYSDLLLHDVAEPDSPGVTDGTANMTEFRTAPLWGLSTSAPYMHDGRSFTVEDAISRHFGEAEDAQNDYIALDASDRAALIAFLESL